MCAVKGPVLIDREIPLLQAKLEPLNKLTQGGGQLMDTYKQEFIELTNHLKLLDDRRKQIVARVGDEYIVDPPKVAAKP